MIFKVATLIAVAVFMVQPNEVMLQYSTNPTSNTLISNLITSANNTLQTALNQTSQIVARFYAEIKTFEANVQSNVSSILAQIDADIAAKVTAQGGLASKIYNCTKLEQSKIDAFANSTFKNLTGCATEKITAGINSITAIYTALANIQTTVANITNRINATCPAPTSLFLTVQLANVACVTSAVTTITLELSKYAITISTNAATLAILIADIPNFPTEFTTCLSTRAATAATNALPLVADIVQCTLTTST